MSKKKRSTRACKSKRMLKAQAGRPHSGSNVVWHQSAEEATLARKPRYNGFACGHGAHGSSKYDRTKQKRAWKSQLGQEGASRGSFLLDIGISLAEMHGYAVKKRLLGAA